MGLPFGLSPIAYIKGDKGNTGSLAFATAETVPWSQGASVDMVGPESARGAHFKIPMSLPTPETVNNDEATAALILSLTETREAIERLVARRENVFTEADIAPAIARIVQRGSGVLAVPHGVKIFLTDTINLPDEVSHFVVDGHLVMTVDKPIINRAGAVVGDYTPINLSPNAGNREIYATHSDLALADWIFVASTDTLPGTSDKLGYIRQVRALTPTIVTTDAPLPRSMPTGTNRRLRKLRMARPIVISGDGEMEYQDPSASTSQMMTFTLVNGVYLRGVFLHDGGATAVSLRHCVNAHIAVRIDRMIDNLPTQVGYGVNVGGACRNVVVEGFISRCRHAVTTNNGPGEDIMPDFPFYGEPENFVFQPVTAYCTDKALDTHRAGFGGRMIANDMGSGGVVQVRCDAVYVEVRAMGNFFGDIVTIAPNLVGTTVVGPVVVSWNTAAVIKAFSDVMCTAFPVVYGGGGGTLFAIAEGVSLQAPIPTQYGPAAGDQDFASATTSAISGMIGYLAANATYILTAHIIYRAAAAVDCKLGWSAPSGTTINWTAEGLDVGATTSQGTVSRASLTAADEAQFGGVAAGTSNVVSLAGRVVAGATPGPLQLKAGQRVETAGSPAQIRAGSYMKLERVR